VTKTNPHHTKFNFTNKTTYLQVRGGLRPSSATAICKGLSQLVG